MPQDTFERYYLTVVSDHRFSLFGLTVQDILKVRERMDMYAALTVTEVLKEIPNG